jgi:hypothetical protein
VLAVPEKAVQPLRNALRILRSLASKAWSHSGPGWWGAFTEHELKRPGARMISPTALERFEVALSSCSGMAFGVNDFLVLPVAPRTKLSPVLWLRIDLGRVYPDLRLRVALVDGLGKAVMGLRFESPEGPGLHNYYHVQMIKPSDLSAKTGGGRTAALVHQPAFPMPVAPDQPVQLVYALLYSIYSGELSEHAPARDPANKDLQDWLRGRAGPRESYWVVPDGTGTVIMRSWRIDGRGQEVLDDAVRERNGERSERMPDYPEATHRKDDRYTRE